MDTRFNMPKNKKTSAHNAVSANLRRKLPRCRVCGLDQIARDIKLLHGRSTTLEETLNTFAAGAALGCSVCTLIEDAWLAWQPCARNDREERAKRMEFTARDTYPYEKGHFLLSATMVSANFQRVGFSIGCVGIGQLSLSYPRKIAVANIQQTRTYSDVGT